MSQILGPCARQPRAPLPCAGRGAQAQGGTRPRSICGRMGSNRGPIGQKLKKQKIREKEKQLVFRLKFRGSRGLREEGTEHTKLYSRMFTGFGLTRLQKVNFSTFDGKLEGDFITEWSQNLPFGPRPREQELLFSIFTYPIIHLKNTKK